MGLISRASCPGRQMRVWSYRRLQFQACLVLRNPSLRLSRKNLRRSLLSVVTLPLEVRRSLQQLTYLSLQSLRQLTRRQTLLTRRRFAPFVFQRSKRQLPLRRDSCIVTRVSTSGSTVRIHDKKRSWRALERRRVRKAGQRKAVEAELESGRVVPDAML